MHVGNGVDAEWENRQAERALLIVWHSRTGAAQAIAQAAGAGAVDEPGAAVRTLRAAAAGPDDMLAAAGYLFVCPENLGSMSGAMKEFFDRCYYPLLGRIEGRGYATAVSAGNAGQGAEAQIDRIVAGWRLRRVAPSLIVRSGADTPAAIAAPKQVSRKDEQSSRDLGRAFAAGLHLGIF